MEHQLQNMLSVYSSLASVNKGSHVFHCQRRAAYSNIVVQVAVEAKASQFQFIDVLGQTILHCKVLSILCFVGHLAVLLASVH